MKNKYEDFLRNFENQINTDKKWEREEEHAYEQAIVESIRNNKDNDNFIDYLQRIVNEDNEKVAEKVRYAAYCTLHTYYRRMEKHTELVNLDKKYAELFQENHISAEHFRLLLYVDSSPLKVDVSILERAEKSAKSMPDHTGAWHLLADLTARYYESKEGLDQKSIEQEKWYQNGMSAVNQAIERESDYAKFYATRARLYYLSGKYPEALTDIKIAIENENSLNRDYAVRLSRYQELKSRIESQIV